MDEFNNKKIYFLEKNDVENGKLKLDVTKGKITIVMCQGTFCGYCTQAKPAFIKLSEKFENNVTFCTILIDGTENEQELTSFIKECDPNYKGVPTYLFFKRDGTYISTHKTGRDVDSLSKALTSLLIDRH